MREELVFCKNCKHRWFGPWWWRLLNLGNVPAVCRLTEEINYGDDQQTSYTKCSVKNYNGLCEEFEPKKSVAPSQQEERS